MVGFYCNVVNVIFCISVGYLIGYSIGCFVEEKDIRMCSVLGR